MHEHFRAVTIAVAFGAGLPALACSDASAGGDGGGGVPTQDGGTGGANAAAGGQASASGGIGNASGGTSPTGGTSATSGGDSSSGGSGDSPGTGGSPEPDPGCGSIKWACWPMPNAVGNDLPNEASYVDGGDGTVLDETTGLVWEKDAVDENGTWDDALAYCDALELGGKSNWRLPTRIEITSVLDYGKPGWAEAAFPGAPGAFHRSASDWILTINQQGAGAGTDFAWAFNMSDGIVSNAYSKASDARYRCVHSEGSGESPSEPAVQPPDQYTAIAGEVRDNYTGLVWEAGDSDEVDHAGALEYCEELELGGQTWRLPSIRELATLVDEAKVAPAIDESMFPDTKYGSRSNNWYWAADLDAQADAAWALNFDDGFTGTNKGADGSWNYFTAGFARCVR
jgi:hypothetical protein